MNDLKKSLLQEMISRLTESIDSSRRAIESAIESRNTATKSSAGDKHETGRALMQIEIENQEKQLSNSLVLRNILEQIPEKTSNEKVSFGNLLETDKGWFYLSISLGKIQMKNMDYLTISPATPLAKVLLARSVGDLTTFQGKNYRILQIL